MLVFADAKSTLTCQRLHFLIVSRYLTKSFHWTKMCFNSHINLHGTSPGPSLACPTSLKSRWIQADLQHQEWSCPQERKFGGFVESDWSGEVLSVVPDARSSVEPVCRIDRSGSQRSGQKISFDLSTNLKSATDLNHFT